MSVRRRAAIGALVIYLFKFRNYRTAGDPPRLLKEGNLCAEFGQSAIFSIRFLLRVPPEKFRMRMAGDLARLAKYPPHGQMVRSGIRTVDGSYLLLYHG